jgi:hypothetical protein
MLYDHKADIWIPVIKLSVSATCWRKRQNHGVLNVLSQIPKFRTKNTLNIVELVPSV